VKLDVEAIEGIGAKQQEMLAAFKVKTIEDLANWKYVDIDCLYTYIHTCIAI
jgi:predicted flap endonuclease-1-like 5' DNA nuclease